MSTMQSINPATGTTVAEYPTHTPDQATEIINDVNTAWLSWHRTSFDERAKLMRRAADLLDERADELARLMANEMGKPLSQGVGEAKKCANVCRYYADNAATFLADKPLQTDAKKSKVSYQPLGVILTIMPWNFPFWQVFRQIAPSLMAGNTMVLKHASNVPGSALAIESIMQDAGFPVNTFRTLLVPGAETEALITNPHVQAVSLTGSTPAGQQVAATAGSVLKKAVLELGGSDPYLVLDDADIELAAQVSAASRLINTGQSCIAAKRFIVDESVYNKFVEAFTAEMEKYVVGDPFDSGTTVGPMARLDLRDELHEQVKQAVKHGATVLMGCEIPESDGAFYPVSILADVTKDNPVYKEELFGPVAMLIKARDEADAIEIANDTEFGLGGAIFSQDEARAERIASEEIQSGAVFVNGLVASDPRVPFGGIKQSGYGRELGEHGIHEFVNIKAVQIS